MRHLNIKFFLALVLSMFFQSFCFGQNNLAELVDKCDFVNFKKAYEISNSSKDQKAELLKQVDHIIEEHLKKLKFYFGGQIPQLKSGKSVKIVRDIMLAFSGIFFGCSIAPIVMVCETFQRKNNTRNLYNKPAAAFTGNSIAHFARYNAKKQVAVNRYNEGYLIAGVLFGFCCLCSGMYAFLYKWYKSTLIAYKRWKKALKIKKLIEDSKVKMVIVENPKLFEGLK